MFNVRVQNRQIPIEISIKIIIEAENYTQAPLTQTSSDLVMPDFNTVISFVYFLSVYTSVPYICQSTG